MKKNKAKIVRIITRLNIGGPAMHVILLSSCLNKNRFESHLIFGQSGIDEGDMSGLARENNVDVEYIAELRRDIGFYDFVAFLKLVKLMRKIKPDIVHTHTAKAGTLGRLAALACGVPIRIHTFHGHIFDGYFSLLKSRIFTFIERSLAYFTDRLVTVSETVRAEIVDKLGPAAGNKCVVIRLGLDLDRFLEIGARRGSFRKEFGIDDDCVLIGIVGRLVPIKNHILFLDVARRIKDSFPGADVKFVVVGDGETKGTLADCGKKLRLEKDVFFSGWAKDLTDAYADIDIITLTSLNEGTPVSIIEAMASGRPVVAMDVGGVKDIVSDGEDGFLVKPGDAEDFAAKLLKLVKDKEMREKFGSAGRESVRDRYTKDRLAGDIERLYEECLSKMKG